MRRGDPNLLLPGLGTVSRHKLIRACHSDHKARRQVMLGTVGRPLAMHLQIHRLLLMMMPHQPAAYFKTRSTVTRNLSSNPALVSPHGIVSAAVVHQYQGRDLHNSRAEQSLREESKGRAQPLVRPSHSLRAM